MKHPKIAKAAEILGYIGMALVVSSFFFTDIIVLRLVNIAGSVLSAAFAFTFIVLSKTTEQLPTAILNSALIIINVVMLFVQ